MKNQISRWSSIVGTLVVLAGCSAHVDGGGAPPVLPDVPVGASEFKDKVPGPNVDGVWKSVCTEDARSANTWDLLTLTIASRKVTRHTAQFSDSGCAHALDSRDEQGVFIYNQAFSANRFEVTYHFQTAKGVSEQYEVFKLDTDGRLWVSNEVGGDGAAVNVKLTKDQPIALPPAPPTPAPPTAAPIAAGAHRPSYGNEVKYKGISHGIEQLEDYTVQGYDTSAQTWTVYRSLSGAANDMGYSYLRSVWSSADTKDILDNCAARGGTRQVIAVPAGTFDSCMIDSGISKTWYGDVPVFGKIKIQRDDGGSGLELQSFSW